MKKDWLVLLGLVGIYFSGVYSGLSVTEDVAFVWVSIILAVSGAHLVGYNTRT